MRLLFQHCTATYLGPNCSGSLQIRLNVGAFQIFRQLLTREFQLLDIERGKSLQGVTWTLSGQGGFNKTIFILRPRFTSPLE